MYDYPTVKVQLNFLLCINVCVIIRLYHKIILSGYLSITVADI